MPLTYPAVMTALLVKHCISSCTVICRGVFVNSLVPYSIFLIFLCMSLLCVRSCIHIHLQLCGYIQYTHSIIDQFEIISFVTLLTFSNEASWSALLFSFSALVASSKPFILSAEILFSPTLCFNSEKQAPIHLSVFPYLLPHCVLQDLSTIQVTRVGGVEV